MAGIGAGSSILDADWAGHRPSLLPSKTYHKSLGRDFKKSPALFTSEEVAAEEAFTDLCERFHAVGCWEGNHVIYHLLKPAPPSGMDLFQGTGWTLAAQAAVLNAIDYTSERNPRLLGYVGWLLSEPAFLRERDELREAWKSFPVSDRPVFPMGRTVSVPMALSRQPSSSQVAFADTLREFLNRWGLTLPIHYPLQGDDDLLHKILEYQQAAARSLGLDESLAGIPHYKTYTSMFKVGFLEYAIRNRVPAERKYPCRGLHIEGAMADGLAVSVEQVQKCRKAISACLRGQRSRCLWLKTKR